MPICSAVNCNNSTLNGYRIYNLPNGKGDLRRREVWLSNMRRGDFNPPKRAGLCKEHFDSDQFERRVPGKLKWNAIPTLFDYSVRRPVVEKPTRIRKRSKTAEASDSEGTSTEPPVTISGVELSVVTELEKETTAESEGGANAVDSEEPKENATTDPPRKHAADNDEDVTTAVPDSPPAAEKEDGQKEVPKTNNYSLRKLKKRVWVEEEVGNEEAEEAAGQFPRRTRRKIRDPDFVEDGQYDSDDLQSSNDVSAVTWSEAAIKKALHLRFSCGYNGYNVLREQGLPLPSDDTLRRKLEIIPFKNGLLDDILKLLQSRVQSLDDSEKKVSLIIDEIAIQPSLDYDNRSESIVGLPTIVEYKTKESQSANRSADSDEEVSNDDSDDLATHCIVFTLQGLASFWKQTVAYQLTGNSFRASDIKVLIINLIARCHDIGLDVKNVILDVGDRNEAVMQEFGITFSNILDISNAVPHPVAYKTKLYFFSSFPNLLKGLRNHLIAGEGIFLPEATVAKYNLPSNIVSLSHVHRMLVVNSEKDLKQAPHLRNVYIAPVHYEKLKENPAQNLFSRETAAALRVLVGQKHLSEEALSTAWFFEQVSIWYELVTAKNPPVALSQFSVEKLNAAVKTLNDFIVLILSMNMGSEDAIRKHIQKEIFISTTSVTMIKNNLFHSGDCMDGFNQNFLENLFCIIRFRNSVPTALEMKNALRLISLSQLLKGSSHGSYTVDPTVSMPISALRHVDVAEAIKLAYSNKNSGDLHLSELKGHTLYNLCVFCVTRYVRFNENCDTCVNFIVLRGNPCVSTPSLLDLTPEHCYSPDSHTYASLEVYNFLEIAEKAVLGSEESIVKSEAVLPTLREKALEKSVDIVFPDCHEVKQKLLDWYLNVRIFSFLNSETC